MNEKRGFFRVHVVTVAAAVLLAALCFAAQTYPFKEYSYSLGSASIVHLPGSTPLIIEHVKISKGWPYEYRIRVSGARCWELDLPKTELAALQQINTTLNLYGLISAHDLNRTAPTALKLMTPDSAKENRFSTRYPRKRDESLLNENLVAWAAAIFVFCFLLEVALRLYLRRDRKLKAFTRAALHPISLRFSLLTALFFTLTSGVLLGVSLHKFETTALSVEIKPYEYTGDANTDGFTARIGDRFVARRAHTQSVGWPEIHERKRLYCEATVDISPVSDRQGNESPHKLYKQEFANLRRNFDWKSKIFGSASISESTLQALAPMLYSEAVRTWKNQAPAPKGYEDKDILYRNAASCAVLALLIAFLAEFFQRAWRWRRARVRTAEMPATPPSSPQSPAQ